MWPLHEANAGNDFPGNDFVLTFGLASGYAASAAVPYNFSACLTSQGALNSVSITSGPADSRPCLKGWSSQ